MLVTKKLSKKNCSQKIFQSQKNFSQKKILTTKKFQSQNFFSHTKNFSHKIFLVTQKNLVTKKFQS